MNKLMHTPYTFFLLYTLTGSFAFGQQPGDIRSCEEDLIVSSLTKNIKESAKSSAYRDFYNNYRYKNKSLNEGLLSISNIIEKTEIEITNIASIAEGGGCTADVSITLNDATLAVINTDVGRNSYRDDFYREMDGVTVMTGLTPDFHGNKLRWKRVPFVLTYSKPSNNVNIDLSSDAIQATLALSARMAYFSLDMISWIYRDELVYNIHTYAYQDRELNKMWGGFNKELKGDLKKSQMRWVRRKIEKCGELPFQRIDDDFDKFAEDLDVKSLKNYIDIFKCSGTMTSERINVLTGSVG